MTGETEVLKNIQNRKLVKLISGKVLAGLTEGYEPADEVVEDVMYIPGIKSKKDCFAIQVSGTSMEPEIKEGSTIIIERLEDKSEFRDNQTYVVILQGIPFIKKVSMVLGGKEKGVFELSSINEDRIQEVKDKDISAWYKVSYVINPV